jgi:hypothetical protein
MMGSHALFAGGTEGKPVPRSESIKEAIPRELSLPSKVTPTTPLANWPNTENKEFLH